jgi:hypothetical protein
MGSMSITLLTNTSYTNKRLLRQQMGFCYLHSHHLGMARAVGTPQQRPSRHQLESQILGPPCSGSLRNHHSIAYTYQDTVLQKDRSIFIADLHELSAGNTNHIRQWNNTHQAVILKSEKAAKTNAVLNAWTINTYFPIQGHN